MVAQLKGKKVLILGTGGTSKTAVAVATAMGAREILTVSRTAKSGAISYADAYAKHTDAEFLINTTPCGMYPKCADTPIELAHFSALGGVMDAIYNPLQSTLVQDAKRSGIPASGGLYMLVAQAVLAAEHFTGMLYGEQVIEDIYQRIRSEKQNIVLVGMPGCGKSTVGAQLASVCKRELIDTDRRIVERAGMEISEIFARYGEAHFRRLECEVIREASGQSGCVIATGGGAILSEENVDALRQNGRIYFLDRPVEEMLPTADRPLARTVEDVLSRYRERYERYCTCADEHVKTLGGVEQTAEEIIAHSLVHRRGIFGNFKITHRLHLALHLSC